MQLPTIVNEQEWSQAHEALLAKEKAATRERDALAAERLKHLVEQGMLERRPYSERPPRHEYVLTPMGQEFMDVLMAMVAWGDRWTAGDAGPPVLYRHHACGQIAHVEPCCSACGEAMRSTDIDLLPGPGLATES